MVKKDDKFVNALIAATKEKKVSWTKLKYEIYKVFKEVNEKVENAFVFSQGDQNIIIYKASTYYNDPELDMDVEKSNIHIVFTDPGTYKPAYKLSDRDLNEGSSLWTLYKVVSRQASGAENIMDEIINNFGSKFDF